MPDTRPGTAPDEKRKCGTQPAHQSLFTDVFRSRPLLCTIHPVPQLLASTRGDELSRALCLTWDIRDSFLARLHALGEAHELLTTENWDRASLREVVGRAIKPFQSAQERFVIEGAAVWVPAQASLTLTLCLHELTTNAVKYGALSNGTGRVHVAWVAWEAVGNGERRNVRLTWHE